MNEDTGLKLRTTIQDPEKSPPRRATKSAPTTPKRSRVSTFRAAATEEDVPDIKLNLERLRAKNLAAARGTVSPGSGNGTRIGHNFTVGNISNGLIYLRPVARPAHEMPRVLQATSPNAAAERRRKARDQTDETGQRDDKEAEKKRPAKSPLRIPSQGFVERAEPTELHLGSSPPLPPRLNRHRAHSFSTITSRSTHSEAGYGGYRIVIDRAEPQRPKTAGPQPSFSGLQVNIPHYTIGSPRFSPHGTPFIEGSSSINVPSTVGELGSATNSQLTDFKRLSPFDSKRLKTSEPIDPLQHSPQEMPFVSPPPSMPSPIQLSMTPPVIEAHIYDSLSFPPQSEHPSIVKYDSRGNIIAATVPRIIAQITSATFLDYQLLSDFFLTFRLFMSPSDLVSYLIARLRWAIDRSDDAGRVVRVRTFVAIRHWLLNYFADDFVPSFSLRKKFAKAINDLSRVVLEQGAQCDVKIIRELKKCWRRTCALYWENEADQIVDVSIEKDIFPGGPPGQRIAYEKPFPYSIPPFPIEPYAPIQSIYILPGPHGSNDLMGQNIMNDSVEPAGAENPSNDPQNKPLPKAASDASIHATAQSQRSFSKKPISAPFVFTSNVSSFKPASKSTGGQNHTSSIAQKKTRPSGHKRSGSFSDALRDYRQPLPIHNSIARSTHLLMAFPYAGSLVRGNLRPPTAAVVEVIAPSTPGIEIQAYELNPPWNGSTSTSAYSTHNHTHIKTGIASPGVKRLLGSVRRALGGKAGSQGLPGMYSPVPIPRYGPPDLTVESASRHAALNNVRSSMGSNTRSGNKGRRGSMNDVKNARIDLLGAGVVDAFQKVLQETSQPEQDNESEEETNPDPGKRVIQNRRTIDTCIAADSATTESFIANLKLAPTTRKRGNTLCQKEFNAQQKRDGIPIIDANKQSGTKINRENRQINLAQQGRNGVLHAIPQSESSESTPKFEKPKFLDFNLFSQKSDSHSLLSELSYRRHSDISAFDGSSEQTHSFSPARQPGHLLANRMLRRRPGGDLRAAATVTDLESHPRAKSVGSMETFSITGSFTTSSGAVRLSGFAYGSPKTATDARRQQLAAGVVSLGAVAKGGSAAVEDDILSEDPDAAKETFEAGVLKLAALPDTESDDGGVEIALMKLEGRYDRNSAHVKRGLQSNKHFKPGRETPNENTHKHIPLQVGALKFPIADRRNSMGLMRDDPDEDDSFPEGNKLSKRVRRRHKQILDQIPLGTPPALESDCQSILGLPTESGKPDNSLLSVNQVEGPRHPSRKFSLQRAGKIETPGLIIEEVFGPNAGASSREEEPRDDLSELSSEVSFEMVSRRQSTNDLSIKFPPPTVIQELGLPCHPLRHPPSPPLTLEQALALGPVDSPLQRLGSAEQAYPFSAIAYASPSSSLRRRRAARESIRPLQPPSVHLPFILAYDSELLAKQFTLIEKDALNEVDWKELVELRWKQTSITVRDWVEFLKSKNVRGVEVVIARFNLMWKWAMSEIVMTKQVDERARTIVKLIHIAVHARRLQNYATMYQITAALLTSNVARLRKTWQMVPLADLTTFREMEALIQPVRNFHNLRSEMDKVTGESGCIPFVGLFTHDLIYNAQRPSHLTGTSDGELLVNFEKHRMTASIIKRLLRLIEASHKYDFKAVDGACERCLWIAALSDDEIRGLSKNLE